MILDNVDDYLSPSQACINPAFQPPASGEPKDEEKKNDEDSKNGAVVVPRARRRHLRNQRQQRPVDNLMDSVAVVPSTPLPNTASKAKDDIVKASIADCLACSGCVTTAETVLLEQTHSLTSLKARRQMKTSNVSGIRALTISPNSLADFCRHYQLENTLRTQRQITTLLSQILNVSVVIDGNLPLTWMWQVEAQEFCTLYRQREQIQEASRNGSLDIPMASTPIDAYRTLVYTAQGNQVQSNQEFPFQNQLPLISASCPAVVCWIEKSKHALIRHLSKAKSPMSLMGRMLALTKGGNYMEHWAIMPCHDKKLEASRKDFVYTNGQPRPDVDLVITTSECVQLCEEWVQEQAKSTEIMDVPTYLASLDLAAVMYHQIPTVPPRDSLQWNDSTLSEPIWVTCQDSTLSMADATDTNNPFQAGGHAHYIFQYACQELFGYKVRGNPWHPATQSVNHGSTTSRVRSARLAKRKEYLQAVLYLNVTTGEYYTTAPEGQDDALTSTPVLKFCMAHGLQTLQRVLPTDDDMVNPSTRSATPIEFDFIEAMACPMGCVNGGGQQQQSSSATTTTTSPTAPKGNIMTRETPTESRQRVQQTLGKLQYPNAMGSFVPEQSVDVIYTRYHVVPPMQHTMGAAAGVAVQDMQW